MANLTHEHISWWFATTTYSLGVVTGCIIAVIHTRNVCLDRRISGSKSTALSSKVISYCTLCSVYCYILNMLVSALSVTPMVYKLCPFIAINGSWTYLLAKMFMYLGFIWRLHAVYSGPAYRYRKSTLKIMTTFILSSSLVINILITARIRPYAGFTIHEYMRYCHADIDAYLAALIALYDFGLSLYFCVVFINPLRKLIKDTMSTDSSNPHNVDLLRAAAKAAILTSTACITTIIFMTLVGLNLAAGMSPFDFLTNIICIVLMSPYYNKLYYQRLCCLPIRCSGCCMWCCCGFSPEATDTAANVKMSQSPSQGDTAEAVRIRSETDITKFTNTTSVAVV